MKNIYIAEYMNITVVKKMLNFPNSALLWYLTQKPDAKLYFLKTIAWNITKGKKIFRKKWYFLEFDGLQKIPFFEIMILWLNKPKIRIPRKKISQIEVFRVDFWLFPEIWEQSLFLPICRQERGPTIRGYVRKNLKTFYCNFGIFKPCSIK